MLPNCCESTHSIHQNQQPSTCAKVMPILLAIGIIVALGVSLAGVLGHFQVAQVNSLVMMAAGGGIGLTLLIAFVIYKIKSRDPSTTTQTETPSAEEVKKPNSKALNSQPVNYEFRWVKNTKIFDDFSKIFKTVLKTTHLPNLAKETKLIFLFMFTPSPRYVSTFKDHKVTISNILRENLNAKFFVLCAYEGEYQPHFNNIRSSEFNEIFPERGLDGFVWLDLPYDNRAEEVAYAYTMDQNIERVLDCVKESLE